MVPVFWVCISEKKNLSPKLGSSENTGRRFCLYQLLPACETFRCCKNRLWTNIKFEHHNQYLLDVFNFESLSLNNELVLKQIMTNPLSSVCHQHRVGLVPNCRKCCINMQHLRQFRNMPPIGSYMITTNLANKRWYVCFDIIHRGSNHVTFVWIE